MLPHETVEDGLPSDKPYHHQVSNSCCMFKTHIFLCTEVTLCTLFYMANGLDEWFNQTI